jgi:hypothetical protein
MSDESPVFERIADELEVLSRMSRIEARGTLRLALRDAGLVPKTINAKAMLVVLERILPPLLVRRGVSGGPEVCRTLSNVVRSLTSQSSLDVDTPEKVFARIAPTSRRSVHDTLPPSSRSPSSNTPLRLPQIPPPPKPPSGPGWSLFSKSRGPKLPDADD